MKLPPLPILALMALLSSCKNEHANVYAIRDFRPSLQPFLVSMVTTGYVTYHDSKQINSITDSELESLSKSENPVIRATALREMNWRGTFDKFELLAQHLDDTAFVAIDEGEFGMGFKRVSDYLLERAYREDFDKKKLITDLVLSRHNYLRSAYKLLYTSTPIEPYYSIVKDMATRPRRLEPDEGYELGFDEIEYALYGLARFKKPEDVQVIKNKMMQHVTKLSEVSFRLMKNFPDTSYMDVLRAYHRRQFYLFSGARPHGFTGVKADLAAPEDFIAALLAQQSEQSARLLDTVITRVQNFKCMPDREGILDAAMTWILEHQNPVYASLQRKIRPQAETLKRQRMTSSW